MPQKIDFSVIQVTGEDEEFPASELNSHAPTVKGWQSSRFCPYPQEIIIQLEFKARITKIQLLSHHYLIASKIELNAGDIPKGMLESPSNIKWRYLGEVILLDNSRTEYKARELKSIIVEVPGSFIKFVLHQNYVNKLNLCNQVGIVAINVIGDRLPPKDGTAKIKYSANLQHPAKRSEVISPLDDISFGMYVETEVAQIMQHLYARKQKAVRDERFVYAKKLKYALSELRKIGEKLGKYEIEKQQAVEAEDYDKARLKKQQMDEYRIQHYERLRLPELLEMEGITN